MKNIIWIAALGAGAYALYEWALTQCATSGSSLYGGTICGYLNPSVAPASTAIVSTATPGTNPTPAQQSNPITAAPVQIDPKPLPLPSGPATFRCTDNAMCAVPNFPLITAAPGPFSAINTQLSGLSGNRIPSSLINRRRMA